LLWAAGYFADTNYYFSHVKINGLRSLNRGQKYVSPDGTVHGARFEHTLKKMDDWSWFDNPFVGTKEFDGLRVMMALVNQWDLKTENNAIYDAGHQHLRYVVSDIGGSFGRTGGGWTRSKGSVNDYCESKFVDKVTPTNVTLVLHSRPPLPYAVRSLTM